MGISRTGTARKQNEEADQDNSTKSRVCVVFTVVETAGLYEAFNRMFVMEIVNSTGVFQKRGYWFTSFVYAERNQRIK